MEFHVGDRVKLTHSKHHIESLKEGTVINLHESSFLLLVEFDDFISGHDGNGVGKVRGKPGHCWWCDYSHIKLISKKVSIDLKDLV